MTAKISSALRDYRFQDALILLFEMYVRKIPPKLGALQRWVRECDATSTPDSPPDPDAMQCLDLILRLTAPRAEISGNQKAFQLTHRPVWSAREDMPDDIKIWGRVKENLLFGKLEAGVSCYIR